jgi:hypothetical protein
LLRERRNAADLSGQFAFAFEQEPTLARSSIELIPENAASKHPALRAKARQCPHRIDCIHGHATIIAQNLSLRN